MRCLPKMHQITSYIYNKSFCIKNKQVNTKLNYKQIEKIIKKKKLNQSRLFSDFNF